MTNPTSTETSTERKAPRAMLALIALATNLPVPKRISFHPSGVILSLDFDGVTDRQAWSAHLGGSTDTYVNRHNGRRYVDEGVIDWHGWSVQIHASDERSPDTPLDADATATLMALAGQ